MFDDVKAEQNHSGGRRKKRCGGNETGKSHSTESKFLRNGTERIFILTIEILV